MMKGVITYILIDIEMLNKRLTLANLYAPSTVAVETILSFLIK